MSAITPSHMNALVSRSLDRSAAASSHAPVAPSASLPVVEYRRAKADRRWILGCAMVLLFLLDLNCVMWAIPAASQIAEWGGVPLLDSVWVGLSAMAATVPLTVAISIYAWRRMTAK